MKRVFAAFCCLLGAAVGVQAGTPSPATNCKISDSKYTPLESIGDVHAYRVDSGILYASFMINLQSQTWVDGIDICGEGSSHYVPEKTRFRRDNVGKYAVYSAHCGGRMDPLDAKAQVVFDQSGENRGKLVYVRSQIKIAKYSWENGAHSGPLKNLRDALVCKDKDFDESQIEILNRFDHLEAFLHAGSQESVRSIDLYRTINPARNK